MLSFASAVGNLFNRLGKCGLLVRNVYSVQQTLLTSMTNTTTGVVAQYNAESDLQAVVGSAYISTLGGVEGACTLAQNLAVQTINRMVYRDNPRIAQNLQSVNLIDSLNYVIQQMQQQGATVLAMPVTGTPTAFVGVGTGVVNVSVKRPFDGRVLENSFQEAILLTCNQDSYTGNATLNNEGFLVTTPGNEQDVFAFDWPLGSNASTSVSAIDGNTSNGSGNLLVNSGFDAFTANVPNNWTVTAGAGGTNLFQETVLVLGSSSAGALKITGDAGGTLVSFYQPFGSSLGTTTTLSPQTQYSFCMYLRRDAVVPAAGQLVVELIDQNGNNVADNAGVANSFTIALTGLTTSYVGYVGTFRTPTILPTSMSIRVRMPAGNALTSGRSVYLDVGSLGLHTQVYTSGPSVAVHAGGTPFEQGDYGTAAIVNSRGAGGTLSTFQTLLNQFYGLQALDLLIPSSSSPSISDSLIG